MGKTDIGVFDNLNRLIRFGSKGEILDIDRDAVQTQVARMTHAPLRAELSRCIAAGTFADNRLIASSDYLRASGLMAAMLSTPYIKDRQDRRVITIQAFEFSDLGELSGLRTAYPAPDVRPVAVGNATTEIGDIRRFVAVFPDSVVGDLPQGYADSFYFCGKFVEAYDAAIRPLLDLLWSDASFIAVRAASTEDLHNAAAIWVHLHEYFHCSAILPIAEFGHVKSTRLAGAFEELRVDLGAMLADLAGAVGPRMAAIVFEFILAFRLIYYGSSFDPVRDYDAVSSVALSNVLEETGCILCDTDGCYIFPACDVLRKGLAGVFDQLTEAEADLSRRLRAHGGGRDRQCSLRVEIEDLMRSLGKADAGAPVHRGPFHDRHNGGLQAV